MSFTPIDQLANMPTLDSPTTFNSRAFQTLDDMQAMIGQMNALATYLNDLALASTGPGTFSNIAATGNANIDGNIAAGTTGDDAAAVFVRSTSTGLGKLAFEDAEDNDVGQILYDHASDAMLFYAGASEGMRLVGGRVGIGTSSPDAYAHIVTTGGTNTGLLVDTEANYSARIENSHSLGLGDNLILATNRDAYNATGNYTASLLKTVYDENDDGSPSSTYVHVHLNGGTNVTAGGTITYSLRANGSAYFADNVSIGGSTSLGKLSIYGDDGDTYVDSGGRTLYVGTRVGADGASVQVGNARSADGYAYIDFVGDTTYTDYGLRMMRYPGANGSSRIHHRGTSAMQFYNQEAAIFTWFTSGSEVMRMNTGGHLTVATTDTSPGSTDGDIGIAVRSDGRIFASASASGLNVNRETSDGEAAAFRRDAVKVGTITVTSSATSFNTSSDERRKENIVPLSTASAYDALHRLEPVEYDWKHNGEHMWGFIAQRHHEVFPHAVTPGELADGGWQMDGASNDLIATLVAVIQDMSSRLENLEQKAA